jgi:hypothetical protein
MRQSQPNFTDRSAEIQAEREAFANYVARYTVALVFEDRPELATGVLVSSEGALFVATARHVAKELPPNDVFCIPKPPGPIRVTPRDEALRRFPATQPAERFSLHVEDRILSADESDDVALLQLRDRPTEFHEMDFYPLEHARSAPLSHTRVIVYGWPGDLGLLHQGVLAAFPRTIEGMLSTRSTHGYDPDRHLLISYVDPAPIDAHGMSGGGVWLSPRSDGLWDPGATILVGIQFGQFTRAGRPLLATRIERVEALLGR